MILNDSVRLMITHSHKKIIAGGLRVLPLNLMTALAVVVYIKCTCLEALPAKLSHELEKLAKQGVQSEILCDFDFENISYEQLVPKWKTIKGDYRVAEGHLEGIELPEEKHVSTAGMELNIGKKAMIYYKVKLNKAKSVIVTLSGKGRGHICRMTISNGLIRVQSDCKPKPFHKSIKKTNSKQSTYEILIKLDKGKMTASVMKGKRSEQLSIEHEYIDWPIDNIRWAVMGGPAEIDDICVVRLD